MKVKNSFYWLVYFNCDYFMVQKLYNMVFKENNLLEQTQLWEVGVRILRFYLILLRGMFCKIENSFYWLVCFFCSNCAISNTRCWFLLSMLLSTSCFSSMKVLILYTRHNSSIIQFLWNCINSRIAKRK